MQVVVAIRKYAKAGFAIIAVVLAVKFFSYYATKDADDLCQSIGNDFSVSKTKAVAEMRGYRYFESTKENTTKIVIPTQDSPFFRFACVVIFDGDTMTHKQVQSDD